MYITICHNPFTYKMCSSLFVFYPSELGFEQGNTANNVIDSLHAPMLIISSPCYQSISQTTELPQPQPQPSFSHGLIHISFGRYLTHLHVQYMKSIAARSIERQQIQILSIQSHPLLQFIKTKEFIGKIPRQVTENSLSTYYFKLIGML